MLSITWGCLASEHTSNCTQAIKRIPQAFYESLKTTGAPTAASSRNTVKQLILEAVKKGR